jgi:hypothetical protein
VPVQDLISSDGMVDGKAILIDPKKTTERGHAYKLDPTHIFPLFEKITALTTIRILDRGRLYARGKAGAERLVLIRRK